ncbi:hypothetical protein CCR94_04830 [Rhodoblastus sphagnicola]|uniref:Methyltransferase type 11 domain-containing protein n=1 Tax=Rhodoblastus sphagnicola TaxID=333368 RepID=A0A2S6ND41_9HYPH|nr:class I SAM-dependent methyltransferase [Rhodoblastus sphagnicola]MBB4198058.1 SAM-dependent methyltransferase [Rhodoblastus sphagnicola]PPQ32514.1 hypothetical protein CCR94_04830 [Rhodoblastus sphagnicola]
MSGDSLRFPPLREGGAEPVWDGEGFVIDGARSGCLRYPVGESGWRDELTNLHKELSDGRHFIDIASRRLAVDALRRHCSGADRTILEIGVSEGHLLKDLQAANPGWRLVGADYTFDTLTRISGLRAPIPLVQFDLAKCPLPDAFADGVVALNVLEHIERDDLAVAQCFRILKPGGVAVIEVPAGPELYDDYDRELMHFRRYRLKPLAASFAAAGFDVLERTHIGFLLYPAFYAYKRASRLRTKSNAPKAAPPESAHVVQAIGLSSRLGAFGRELMATEDFLRRFAYLPFGIRCHLVCRKPLRSG